MRSTMAFSCLVAFGVLGQYLEGRQKAWLILSGLGFIVEPSSEFCLFALVLSAEGHRPDAKVVADAAAIIGLCVQMFFFWPAFSIVFTHGYNGWGWVSWIFYPIGVLVFATLAYGALTCGRPDDDGRAAARLHNILQIGTIAVPLLGFEYATRGELSFLAIFMAVSDVIDIVFVTLDTCECTGGLVEDLDAKTTFGSDIELSGRRSTSDC